MLQTLGCLAIGAIGGALSGLVGVGGGVFIVPALVLLLGMPQHTAQGTTLALLLPPIGLFAFWTYYKNGHVDVRAALLLGAGFLLGSLLGSKLAISLPAATLKRGFGVFLVLVGARLIWR